MGHNLQSPYCSSSSQGGSGGEGEGQGSRAEGGMVKAQFGNVLGKDPGEDRLSDSKYESPWVKQNML